MNWYLKFKKLNEMNLFSNNLQFGLYKDGLKFYCQEFS